MVLSSQGIYVGRFPSTWHCGHRFPTVIRRYLVGCSHRYRRHLGRRPPAPTTDQPTSPLSMSCPQQLGNFFSTGNRSLIRQIAGPHSLRAQPLQVASKCSRMVLKVPGGTSYGGQDNVLSNCLHSASPTPISFFCQVLGWQAVPPWSGFPLYQKGAAKKHTSFDGIMLWLCARDLAVAMGKVSRHLICQWEIPRLPTSFLHRCFFSFLSKKPRSNPTRTWWGFFFFYYTPNNRYSPGCRP